MVKKTRCRTQTMMGNRTGTQDKSNGIGRSAQPDLARNGRDRSHGPVHMVRSREAFR